MQHNLIVLEAIILLDTPILVIEIKMLKEHKSYYLRDTRTLTRNSTCLSLSFSLSRSVSLLDCTAKLHKQITIIF